MAEIWLLVFVFAGKLYASGPHDIETCKVMLAAQRVEAACVNKDKPRERIERAANGVDSSAKGQYK